MTKPGSERRRFKRIFFSAKNEIKGAFKIETPRTGIIKGNILDVSEGGLRFSTPRNIDLNFSTGDQAVLLGTRGKTALPFLDNVQLEIKWVMDQSFFNNIAMGCEFIDINAQIRFQIRQFVNQWGENKHPNACETAPM